MGEIIGKCVEKTNEAGSLREWAKRHRADVNLLGDGIVGTALSSKAKENMPKKRKPKEGGQEQEGDSDFAEESCFHNSTPPSMPPQVVASYAGRPRHVSRHLPSPGLRILTGEPQKTDQRRYARTISFEAGVHCWLWVDDAKTAVLFKPGDRRLIAIARSCDCLIELSSDHRYHVHRGLQRRIDVYARDDRCLTKCLNLLEETFWNVNLRNINFYR